MQIPFLNLFYLLKKNLERKIKLCEHLTLLNELEIQSVRLLKPQPMTRLGFFIHHALVGIQVKYSWLYRVKLARPLPMRREFSLSAQRYRQRMQMRHYGFF